MLAPNELKNKEFNKSLRGYSTEEVDEHFDFIIEKYTEIYRENDELQKLLRLTQSQLDSLKSEENSIRSALVNAQKASTCIINEANERADVIMRSTKNTCDKMIADTKKQIDAENLKLAQLKTQVANFKKALYEMYLTHIGVIDKITYGDENENGIPTVVNTSDISRIVVEKIKNDISGKTTVISGSEVPFAETTENDDNTIEDYDAAPVRVAAEEIIPDTPDDAFREEVIENIRDEIEFSADEDISEDGVQYENDTDVRYVGTEPSIEDDTEAETEAEAEPEPAAPTETGKSIIDSIKKLNNGVGTSPSGEDEEFLRILNSISGDPEGSSTAEFNRVYDVNKRS